MPSINLFENCFENKLQVLLAVCVFQPKCVVHTVVTVCSPKEANVDSRNTVTTYGSVSSCFESKLFCSYKVGHFD